MYYNIPLEKIRNAFHPIIFSHIINESLIQNKKPKSHTAEQLLNFLDKYPLNTVPTLYQEFFNDLKGNPISLYEINQAVLNYDTKDNIDIGSSLKDNLLRNQHIHNIVKYMIGFSQNDYISVIPSNIKNIQHNKLNDINKNITITNNELFLEPENLNHFYLLLSSIFRKQLNLQLNINFSSDYELQNKIADKNDTTSSLHIYSNAQEYTQNNPHTEVLDLKNFEKQLDNSNTTINNSNSSFSQNNKILFNHLIEDDIIKQFNWTIEDKPALNKIKDEDNLKKTVLFNITNEETILFEQIPRHILNDYDFIIEAGLLDKSFFLNYLCYQLNNNNSQYNTVPLEERNTQIYTFISDILNKAKEHPVLLQTLWQPYFTLHFNSFNEPHLPYLKLVSVQELYHVDNESKLFNMLEGFQQQANDSFAGNSPISNHAFIHKQLFELEENKKIFKHIRFNDFLEVQSFCQSELEHFKQQVKPFSDIINKTYNETVFSTPDNIIYWKCELELATPKVSQLCSHPQEQNILYEKLIQEYQNNNAVFGKHYFTLEELQDIHCSYLTHPHKDTQINRQNGFIYSLLKLINNDKDITHPSPLYQSLIKNIPHTETVEGMIDIFDNFLKSPFIQKGSQTNLQLDSMKHIYQYFLSHNDNLLSNNELCTVFYKNNKMFFKVYEQKNLPIFFSFTDIETIKHINLAHATILNHPHCPQEWRTNPDIILANSDLNNIKFSHEELNILFKDEAVGSNILHKCPNLYIDLPLSLKMIPEYAKTFAVNKAFSSNSKLSNLRTIIPETLFQYHDFCIYISQKNIGNMIFIPEQHWNNQQFIQDFFKMVDDKDIDFNRLEKQLPNHITKFFNHFGITSNFSSFLEAYIIQEKLQHKVEQSLNNKNNLHSQENESNLTTKIKKKKI